MFVDPIRGRKSVSADLAPDRAFGRRRSHRNDAGQLAAILPKYVTRLDPVLTSEVGQGGS
jgi:hypothetical protein